MVRHHKLIIFNISLRMEYTICVSSIIKFFHNVSGIRYRSDFNFFSCLVSRLI